MSTDEKPKKDQSPSSHTSGQHRLNLEAEMRRNTPTEVQAAKDRYEQEQSTSTPPPPEEKDPRSSTNPDIQEMSGAATKLTESVDKVCEALVMVFGKISQVSDESHGQTLVLRSLMRLMTLVAVIQAVVAAVMIFLAFYTVQSTKAVEETRRSQSEATKELSALTLRVDKLAKKAEDTKKSVDEVKESADTKPTVELAPDPKKPCDVVVRIVPPKKTSSPPATPPNSDAVEIPVKVDGARTRPDAGSRR